MKKIEFSTLLETTIGPIEVKTVSVPWWLATLSFGFFRKIVSYVNGPAYQRYRELMAEWAERFHFTPRTIFLEETRVFRTFGFRAKLWHKHMVKYIRASGNIISDYHYVMQLFCSLQEAEEQQDFLRARKIRREIERHDEEQARNWRKFLDQ